MLPLPHAALGADRLARRPSCKACQKSATLTLAKKVLYVTRPASCSHPGISACRANDTPTIERIINAFVPRKAFCSSALMQTLEQVSGRISPPLKTGL